MLRRGALSLAAAFVSQLCLVPAVAQEEAPPPEAPPPEAPPAEAAPPPEAPPEAAAPPAVTPPTGGEAAAEALTPRERTEEIVVTGTRIKRKDLTTPAPVAVISRDQIEASGKLSVGDFLQALPEQANAINTGVNNSGEGTTRVNLRGVGPARTLVLVNGRRWVPGGTGADTSVDLNSIPSMAVERIEILKDGASAVYGSDAVAGVVNIITRRVAKESEASVFSGTSYKGDGTATDVNLTTGTGNEKGNALFSFGFFDQTKTMANDRGFSAIPKGFDATTGEPYTAGSGTIPAGRTLSDPAVPGATGNALWNTMQGTGAGSFIWDSASTDCNRSVSGQNSCFRPYLGAGLPEAGEVGDGYNFQPDNYLVTPLRRIQLYSTGDLKLTSNVRAFFEAAYVNRRSAQDLAPEPLVLDGEDVAVSADNVYNPFGLDVFVRRRLSEFGRRTFRQDVDSFRLLGGIDGTLPEILGPLSGWTWDLSVNYGRTQGTEVKQGNLFVSALRAALGPSMMIDNEPTCVTIANDSSTALPRTGPTGCVPLNLFGGPGSITQDQVTPLTFTGVARGTNGLTAFQANTVGDLFPLLSDRPIGIAAGYEHRYQSGVFLFDPITEKGLVTGNKGLNTQGSYSVDELYGELSVPIVSGRPYAEEVEAIAAIRWFDYTTFGSDYTYKFGARYSPFRDFTVRGTYSTAFRAPNIPELFGGREDNFAPVTDPCRGATAASIPQCKAQGVPDTGSGDTSTQLRSTVGGNPDLGAETAKIYTAGVVIEPRWVKNLTATVDYYNMKVDNNISPYGESVILSRCYEGNDTFYCDLITRNPSTHFIDNILNLKKNVGKLETAGIDFGVRYVLPTPSFGRFGVALDATWLQKMDQTLADGTVVHGKNTFDLWSLNSDGGLGGTFPSWKFNLGLRYGLGGLGAGVSTRYLSSFHECGDADGDLSGSGLCYQHPEFRRHVSSYHAEDAFVSYALKSGVGKTNLTVGVNNLSNMPPPTIYNGFIAQTDAYNYDVLGRFFYFRLAQTY